MKVLVCSVLLLVSCGSGFAQARDELVTSARYPGGEAIPYMLTSNGGNPSYTVILMPGGAGHLDPRMQGDKVVFSMGGNFLIRSRELFADRQFVAVSSDASSTPARMIAIVQDIESRYGKIGIYLIGTSNSTYVTMSLAEPLDGLVAGFVHTSSLNRIASFDTRKFKSRHLIVHHTQDACRVTRFSAAESAHRSYGTELIAMEGGISVGDDCEAFAHHGYNGIEKATVEKIKAWIAAVK